MNEPGDDVLARSERTHFQAAVVRSTSLGPDETGKPIEIDDARTNDLRQRAIEAIGRPAAFLENAEVFGELGSHPDFAGSLARGPIHCAPQTCARHFAYIQCVSQTCPCLIKTGGISCLT